MPDTNYFTDADLGILGQNEAEYLAYCKKIRMEYAMYPDELYYPGREKVIRHFLDMDQIFKTEIFRTRFEKQARYNLDMELNEMR